MHSLYRLTSVTLACLLVQTAALAAEPQSTMTSRLVVKLRNVAGDAGAVKAQALAAQTAEYTAIGGQPMKFLRHTTTGAAVFQLAAPLPNADAAALAARLAASPGVVYATPDVRVYAMGASTNDPYAAEQWALNDAKQTAGGAGFRDAWALAAPAKVAVAVIDTGRTTHSDLDANMLPGVDMISDATIAGDGDGRDADPTDAGDMCTAEKTPSSWHGLKIAGIVAAVANNGNGIAGAANAVVIPVRALGRCGGWMSDVADAVAWSAGATIPGLPDNATPARVANVSLGGAAGACPTYMQEAIDYAASRGTLVVASAGNSSAETVGAPASCTGVLVVAAHTASGDLASYSNFASAVSVTAPGGGDCKTQRTSCITTPIVTLGNTGLTVPGSETPAAYMSGTSPAAAQASAAAALVMSLRPDLAPRAVIELLRNTARPHPSSSFCASHAGVCGSGMLDAAAALQAIVTPTVSIRGPGRAVAGGTPVTLALAAALPDAPATIQWTQTKGAPVSLAGSDTAQVNFTAAAQRSTATFHVVATFSNGTSAAADYQLAVNNPAALVPPAQVTGSAGVALSVPVEVHDPDGDAAHLSVVDGPAGLVADGTQLVWALPEPGTYKAHIRATDGEADGSGDGDVAEVTFVIAQDSASGGGSGGGAMGPGWMFALALAAITGHFVRRQRRHGRA